tara:strand:+ start:1596 stop:1859 length:264 start_codon:yes stop_codon:yes gene_type:complete
MEQQQGELIDVGALWMNESKSGNKYLTGKIDEKKVLIFRNKYKEKESQPDYRVYMKATDVPQAQIQKIAKDFGGKIVKEITVEDIPF